MCATSSGLYLFIFNEINNLIYENINESYFEDYWLVKIIQINENNFLVGSDF